MPTYKDNAANRKLDRVGKTYGYSGPGGQAPKASGGGAAAPKVEAQPVAPPRLRRGIKKNVYWSIFRKTISRC